MKIGNLGALRIAAVGLSAIRVPWRYLIAVAAISAAYVCAGNLSLSWAHINASASPVWLASGIGLAALLLWGRRLWPGIFLGVFLVNFTSAGLLASLAIAAGNTLEALVGAWLINTYANGCRAFERAPHIFRFVLFAALLSTSISATVGVSSLSLAGLVAWRQYPSIWLTWWLGDMAGVLLITPLIVIWVTQPRPDLTPKRIAEGMGLLLALLAVGYVVFLAETHINFEFLTILPILWAAFRFGQRGAVTGAIVMSVIALLGTLQNRGPFITQDLNASLAHLQGFMTSLALVALVLAAVTKEALRAQERLQVQDASSRIMAESPDLRVAARRLLQVLCEQAGWSTGAFWEVDRTAGELACVELWHVPEVNLPEFEAMTRRLRFAPGIGLPGRVWSSGAAGWISDVTKDGNFPRAPVAIKEGLHAAFGFPIKIGSEVLGVIECFSHEVRVPDEYFLQMVSDIGDRLGPFIERTRAEEALLRSENELSDMFDTASFGMHWVGPDGTVLRVNRAEIEMLGYTEQEYRGHNIAEFHADAEVIDDILERLRRGETLSGFPARMRCKDGSMRDVLIDASVYWKEGNFVYSRCFTRDVTKLKRAEEARAMLAAIVESSDDAIISKDLNGIVTSWNRGAEHLFGYRAEEMIGQPILRIIPPEKKQEEIDILSRLRKGQKLHNYETVRLHSEGRRIDVALTISPIRNFDGEIVGISKIGSDISDRKRAEALLHKARDELAKANEELETRVQERTADLQQAHASLLRNIEEQKKLEDQLRQAQKMESIGTLAGGIAHDFNNVLNIIRGYATVVSRRSLANPEIVESMQVINEEIERGAAVVRQLLTLARKTETVLAPTDANQIIATLNELIKQTFPKTIEVSLDLDNSLPPVAADPNQLHQMLLNICVNGRDAMPGGGRLTFTTGVVAGEELRHRHPDARPYPYARIAIADTGAGMEESVRTRIFEPFFTTKGSGEGTGLGMAMVYGLIKNHNGFIDVESELHRGTTFSIYLPVAEAGDRSVSPEQPGKQTVAQELNMQRGTVMIVEDEQPMVRLLSERLQRSGYRVLTALDGKKAIDLFRSHTGKIDIVLLDLNLPKVDGVNVVRALTDERPETRVIVASGYFKEEVKEQLLRSGVTDCIQKPYLIDEFLEKVNSVLQSS
jgi:PAS domain S-box-containing protein